MKIWAKPLPLPVAARQVQVVSESDSLIVITPRTILLLAGILFQTKVINCCATTKMESKVQKILTTTGMRKCDTRIINTKLVG